MVELELAVIPKLAQHPQFRIVKSMTQPVLFIMDTKNMFCHVSIVFIIPSSVHMKLKKKMKYPFLTSESYVLGKRLRDVFIENLQIQTYAFIGMIIWTIFMKTYHTENLYHESIQN